MSEEGQLAKELDTNQKILRGDQRAVILRRSRDLIAQSRNYDRFIFLDKSARPFSLILYSVDHTDQSGDSSVPENIADKVGFTNIGKEKYWVLDEYAKKQNKKLSDPPRINEYLSLLRTKDDLIACFGEDNIKELERSLCVEDSGKKLVIDDCASTARSTIKFTRRITEILDPDSSYDFFIIIDSPEDKKPFSSEGWIIPPWRISTSLVSDRKDSVSKFNDAKSFGITRDDDPRNIQRGVQFRNELKEIIVEAGESD